MLYPPRFLAGVDEAGVGCLFGDLCAGAVVLSPLKDAEGEDEEEASSSCLSRPSFLVGLADSKRISERKRDILAQAIRSRCYYGIGVVDSEEINSIGLGEARRVVFHRALDNLCLSIGGCPAMILVDGNLFRSYRNLTHACIPKADAIYPCVEAASVLAKSHRDSRLRDWCAENERMGKIYDLEKNKGYITASHKAAIKLHGYTKWHRSWYNIRL